MWKGGAGMSVDRDALIRDIMGLTDKETAEVVRLMLIFERKQQEATT